MVYDDQIVAPKTLPKTSIVFNLVELEKRPQFPGGEAKMYQFIAKNIQYPHQAKEASIQGKVYAQFVVNKDGSLSDIKVIRGIGGGCDEEAVNAIKNMPNWKPGTQRGKNVNVRFILPVNFKLTEVRKKKRSRKN